MNDKQLQNVSFVASNLGAEYYESDLKLYEKLYPNRPALGEFKSAPDYRKAHFQERMLLEILETVCPDTVLENRGFVVLKGEKKELPTGEAKDAALKKLADTNLEEAKYAEKKALVKILEIETKDQKDATITAALLELQASLIKEAEALKAAAEEAEAAADTAIPPDAGDDKKKEDQE